MEKLPRIILKLDDLGRETPAWRRLFRFLEGRGVPWSGGVIGMAMEDEANCRWLRGVAQSGLAELWHHGLTHAESCDPASPWQEFRGTPYVLQKEHFLRAQRLAEEKLGLVFQTFGAPFNALDDVTLRVLSEAPEIKVLLYGTAAQAEAIPAIQILERSEINLEDPIFRPNAAKLRRDWEREDWSRDYLVLQGHPGQWNAEDFSRFVEIIEFLTGAGAVFMAPASTL